MATATHEEAAGSSPASAPAAAAPPASDMGEALLPKATASYQHPISPWRRRYTVLLVALLAALLSADQNLLAPNLSAAAAYFNLDDAQKDTILGGYLMAAFFLVGAPAALLCGYFADKFNRIYMLAFITVVGEAPCLCTYWVTQLWQFFLVRMLTGIAIGGCFPLVFSLLGDLFPVSQRAAMSAIVQIAVGGGIGGGQLVAGLLGPSTNWRLPFLVMATPTLLLTALLLFTVKEPPRGGFEKALEGQFAAGASYSESITWTKVWRLLGVRSNWIIIFQGIFGCLPWGVMQTYINDYLHLQKGLSVELATTVILLFGVGCAVGVIAGGAAGQALYNWRRPTMAILTGVSVLVGAAPVLFLINADIKATGLGAALAMSALAGFLVSIAGPNLRAIMINVNTPETRGVALALQSVTDDLGKGLGPVIVAGFISRLGRTGAFNLSVSAWFPCGIMLTSLACTMGQDEDAMQAQLAQQSARTLQEIQIDPDLDPPPSGDPGAPQNTTGSQSSGAGLEPGTSHSAGATGGNSNARVLRRPLSRGHRVADGSGGGMGGSAGAEGLNNKQLLSEGHNGGLQQMLGPGRAAAAVAATLGGVVSAIGGSSSKVVVPVVADAEPGVEMQQLLAGVQGSSGGSCHVSQQNSGCHHQQQQQQQEKQWKQQQQRKSRDVFVLEDPQDLQQQQQQDIAPAGPTSLVRQQQQQQQQGLELSPGQLAGSNQGSSSNSSNSSSTGQQETVLHLQQACRSSAAAAISAAGARHRGGHGPKLRGGGHGSGSSGGSSGGSGRGCSTALGEGREEVCLSPRWQPDSRATAAHSLAVPGC